VAQAKGRLWLAEVIWVGERRRYLIAAEDDVDALDSLSMIPNVRGLWTSG
jgi:hypothetical protein